MKRFTAFLLVMVMLLAFIPTASAQALGFSIPNSGWIVNGGSYTLSGDELRVGNYTYDVEIVNGDRTCDITIKGSLAGLTPYQYEAYRYARAIEIPFSVTGTNNLMLNSSYDLNGYKMTMLINSAYTTEKFLVSNLNDHVQVTVTFIDNGYNSYYYGNPGYGYGYGYYDPNYGYINPNPNTGTYIPGYTYCKACGSYFNNQYGYCSYCYANADYNPQSFTSKIAYLKIENIEAAGDQYGNVAVGTSYTYGNSLVLNLAAVNYNDYMMIKNAKDDYVRVRVTPVTTYGNTYPAGTIVRPAAPTTYAMLEGTKKSGDNYVLDENSSFCLTLPGIKALSGVETSTYGLWSDISLFFGADSSDRYNGKIYYQKVVRTNYVSGLVVPSNVTLEVGDTMNVPYTLENTGFAPMISWTALNTSSKPVFVNTGNKITAVNEGVGYLVASFNGQSQTIKVTVTDDDKITVADDKYTVTASSLRVRKGLGTSFSSIGSVKKGTIVTGTGVVSADGKWIQISYNGSYGYVSAQYLKAK